jgi:hypothetical protein
MDVARRLKFEHDDHVTRSDLRALIARSWLSNFLIKPLAKPSRIITARSLPAITQLT